MVVEALAGWLTGSLALVADAGHMLTDTISLGLAWYAFRLSGRAGTAQLTYGFERVKTLVAYTNGVTIFAVSLWIGYEAVVRFIEPEPVLAGPMLWVALAGLVVNALSFFVLHGGDRESLNMRGAILHVMGDMLGSVAAIAAAVIILTTGWTPADPILSVLVAVLILSTALSLMRAAAHVLLEGAPPALDRTAIIGDIVANVSGVREVHHMHLWSLDGIETMATLHACLTDGTDANRAVRAVKERLATKFRILHATVEPEFGQCADQHAGHVH
jgi:cobalt-zinc-cadmium efflux system protein